jgi:hypothetical protein
MKGLTALKEQVKVQCSDGNWDYDPYMHGMANGLICALATIEGKEPKYLDAPKTWGCQECKNENIEISKINAVIMSFTDKIKDRMLEKYNDGKRGWDEQYSESKLIQELAKDIMDIKKNTPLDKFKVTLENVLSRRLIDIAARTMIVWYRHNQKRITNDNSCSR